MRNHLEDWLSPGDKSKRAWKALVHFKETVSTTGRYFILCTCISLRCLCGGFWLPSCSVQQLAYFILASFVTVDAKRKRKASLKGRKYLTCGYQLQNFYCSLFLLLLPGPYETWQWTCTPMSGYSAFTVLRQVGEDHSHSTVGQISGHAV